MHFRWLLESPHIVIGGKKPKGCPGCQKQTQGLTPWNNSKLQELNFLHLAISKQGSMKKDPIYQGFYVILLFNLRQEVNERLSRGSEPPSLGGFHLSLRKLVDLALKGGQHRYRSPVI